MAEAIQSIEIKAPAKKCYDVITDYENYPKFLKESKQVTIEKKSGHTADVIYTLDLIKKFTYKLKMVGKSPKTVSWSFLKGDLMKKNEGEWTLEEKNGVTKATYRVDIEFNLFVPSMISKMLIGSNLPSMLKAFKAQIEKNT